VLDLTNRARGVQARTQRMPPDGIVTPESGAALTGFILRGERAQPLVPHSAKRYQARAADRCSGRDFGAHRVQAVTEAGALD
jgi:hypothetical protein